ncbi:hypothetical protein ABZ567_31875 [Streptomyces sp. NPDC016459]|uniref:hypothetical protein n=1 Tax=Streptomyces sp. NPDC016459 TaxID=3157190 RepID=UPI0033EF570A
MDEGSRRQAERPDPSTTAKGSPVLRPLRSADMGRVMDLLKDTIEQTDAEALGLYLSEPSPTNRFGIGLERVPLISWSVDRMCLSA